MLPIGDACAFMLAQMLDPRLIHEAFDKAVCVR
jgi:hypothetical protein